MTAKTARQAMPQRPATERRHHFDEVATGYDKDTALIEAARCLQCKKAPCVSGCPVGVDIPRFIKALLDGDVSKSNAIIKETNVLPAICGRVCPQEKQCESRCIRQRMDEPVAIGRLERYVADSVLAVDKHWACAMRTGPKVAVVGSGPAGLTCAGALAQLGFQVTIFEALHRPGGVLEYGIPAFRLPKKLVAREIEGVKALGVTVVTDVVVGRSVTIDELMDEMDFAAVFVGSGAGLPRFMGIPGENLPGVSSANEFLTRVNLMRAYRFPQVMTPVKVGRQVAVVGGGNVAMDAARSALRLGAESVTIVYRRALSDMPARNEEIEHAKEEGVVMMPFVNPLAVLADDKGQLTGLRLARMAPGEPDASGRSRPVVLPGQDFVLPCQQIIMAIGNGPNPTIGATTPGLDTQRGGLIVADPQTGRTNKQGVWAGGDIVTGAATVIEAMGAGLRAAQDIAKALTPPED